MFFIRRLGLRKQNRQQGSHQGQSAKDLSTTNYNNVKQNQQNIATETGHKTDKVNEDVTNNKDNEWHDVDKLLKRRGTRNKIEFLVRFMDKSESWIRAKDISPLARSEYYQRMAAEGRRYRRRRGSRS